MAKDLLYKHNKKAYESILEHFETSNRTCVIHPTGTGKSFISLQLIKDNIDKNILILAPTNVILDQFNTNIAKYILEIETSRMIQKEINDLVSSIFPNISFSTYSSVKKQTEKYDYIVFDEFHRIGAKEWGKSVETLLDNNKEAKVLGVSATPIRYLDDMRDMSNEIFNGDIASQMSLAEAIAKEILPIPTYISTLYSFEEDIEEIQNQIDRYKDKKQAQKYQKILDQAKNEIQLSEGLDVIFARNIINKEGRFIVFCKDKEHMREMESMCLEWFKKTNPNIEISEVYSEQGNELNQYYIDYFENDEKKTLKLLFSIEMLNEGLHVKNIDGVIMFRPTISPIIYTQQLGRALSVGNNKHPLIFDIVNNADSLNSIVELKTELDELIDKIIREREQGISYLDYPGNSILEEIRNGFKIIEEKKNIIDVLNNLKVDTGFKWENWYELAKQYYEEHGDLEIPIGYKTVHGFRLGSWICNQRTAFNNKRKSLTEERKQLLEAIGMRFKTRDNDEAWMKFYEEAKKYYEEYGNLEIGLKFVTEDGLRLGKWISTQRRLKTINRLSTEREKLLLEIGMRFKVRDNDEAWMSHYKEAEKYFEEHGNLEVPDKYVTNTGFKLGDWICAQRQVLKGTDEKQIKRIELLKKLNMRFESDFKEKLWMKNYEEAKQYYEEHGNLEMPKTYISPSGVKLGSWIHRIKGLKDDKITPEHKQLLEAIGMEFDYLHKNEIWMKNYEEAKKYYEEHGDLEVPVNYITDSGFKLGSWISYLRTRFKKEASGKTKELMEERKQLLEKIGMRFETNLNNEIWMKYYEIAKKYYEEHGNLEVPSNYKEHGLNLGAWVGRQRQIKKNSVRGLLTHEQEELLLKIGMRFDVNIEDIIWNKRYEEIKKYKEEHGNLEVPKSYISSSGDKLGRWVQTERRIFNGSQHGRLTPDQVQRLSKLGFKWFSPKSDDKMQNEEITKDSIERKKKELQNRLYALLSEYEDSSLPSKDELNNEFINKLNKRK